MKSGKIRLWGDMGEDPRHIKDMEIQGPTDLASLDTLATWITTNVSNCTLYATTFSQVQPAVGGAPPGLGVNVDRIAVMVLQDATTGGTIRHEIGGVKPEAIESTPDGERILQTLVTSFAAEYTTATGRQVVGLYGYVYQRK